MFLEQYNSLMGSMLSQQHALAKLRAEIEGREGRVYWGVESLGTWSITAETRRKRKKGNQFLRIDLR